MGVEEFVSFRSSLRDAQRGFQYSGGAEGS